MDWELIAKLLLILFLVVGNAFFVVSEIALTSARLSRIDDHAARDDIRDVGIGKNFRSAFGRA